MDGQRPALSDEGRKALQTLMDVSVVDHASVALADLVQATGALFHEPVTKDGLFVNTGLPIARKPVVALQTLIHAAVELQDAEVRTHFGPMNGLPQGAARTKLKGLVMALHDEAKEKFSAQYKEAERSGGESLGR